MWDATKFTIFSRLCFCIYVLEHFNETKLTCIVFSNSVFLLAIPFLTLSSICKVNISCRHKFHKTNGRLNPNLDYRFRPMYSKPIFAITTPFGFMSVLVETRNYSILSLAFIVSSFRVTKENLLFETVQSDPPSFF